MPETLRAQFFCCAEHLRRLHLKFGNLLRLVNLPTKVYGVNISGAEDARHIKLLYLRWTNKKGNLSMIISV